VRKTIVTRTGLPAGIFSIFQHRASSGGVEGLLPRSAPKARDSSDLLVSLAASNSGTTADPGEISGRGGQSGA
jgi:hypothetical protein